MMKMKIGPPWVEHVNRFYGPAPHKIESHACGLVPIRNFLKLMKNEFLNINLEEI